MQRVIAWILAVLGGLVATLVGAALILVVVVLLVDWNRFHDEIEEFASEMLGREVRFEHIAKDVGWTTHLFVRGLRVANPPWAGDEPMLRLEEGLVSVRLLPLLRGDLQLARIRLQRPELLLRKDAQGRANWVFETLADGGAPADAGEFPLIEHFAVLEGEFGYRDPGRDLDLDGHIDTGAGEAGAEQPLRLVLEGTLQGSPLSLELSGGPISTLRDTDTPYPLSVDIRFDETNVAASGTALDPISLEAVQLDLHLDGPSLADLFPLFNIPLPGTPPYSLGGKLGYRDGLWVVTDFTGTVGDSDLSGQLRLDTQRRPPLLEADAASNRLVFDDLAGLIGAWPGDDETAPADDAGVFPNLRWRSDRVHAMDMDVSFEGRQVISPLLPIDSLAFRVRLRDGRAEARPLRFTVAGGQVRGEVAFNSRDSPPSADAYLEFDGLALQPFFADTEFVQEMGGRFDGQLYLLGVGNSLADVLATARGDATVAMREGTLSGLLIEAAGADVTEALGLVLGGDVRVPVRCALAEVAVDEGVAEIAELLIDTPDSLLVGKGFVDLGREYYEIQIEARAKDFSLIDVNAPVRVWGPLDDVEYAIGGIDPFPFLEFGDQDDLDCDRLVGDVLKKRVRPGEGRSGAGVN